MSIKKIEWRKKIWTKHYLKNRGSCLAIGWFNHPELTSIAGKRIIAAAYHVWILLWKQRKWNKKNWKLLVQPGPTQQPPSPFFSFHLLLSYKYIRIYIYSHSLENGDLHHFSVFHTLKKKKKKQRRWEREEWKWEQFLSTILPGNLGFDFPCNSF